MTKEEQLGRLVETGVVAVIRTQDGDELVSICEALVEGGIVGVEITMTSPGATEAIYKASKVLRGRAIIGAGSILDPETARIAMLAGADFLVSPITNMDVIAMGKRYGKIVIPGAYTPTEILTAWEGGADVVKVFPATRLGPSFLKDVRGPLPQVKLTPTGGVDINNLGEFLKAGAVFVGVGSALVNKGIVAKKDWPALTRLAADYIAAVQAARAS
ncbi:MAG: bifunctional 4-hydroxy-2-oxoglutarate aldolase/2-dehydro-3-deoxy-phosphogluconate aldolase [Bacillota bacterium]|jgi:2-dehydro-3-deoxyphosphogluconate aldolase/(4S)-4-hydroxy-2-oxoglutarate aldolase|nr:bifunctional 4-hydroxy-2-oxoglutarate aldolase/2-dehydro-3-deoxy-phosphogluconate aldolase [Bacillota bacterium]HHT91748.1 bifunctional 4-hydroxy-2-oxoglutarate aldolase/2-dehydro-3-deoxy-phosphogluconate aldolase [Bacillota bacterium]